jgi:hypothetical protein
MCLNSWFENSFAKKKRGTILNKKPSNQHSIDRRRLVVGSSDHYGHIVVMQGYIVNCDTLHPWLWSFVNIENITMDPCAMEALTYLTSKFNNFTAIYIQLKDICADRIKWDMHTSRISMPYRFSPAAVLIF